MSLAGQLCVKKRPPLDCSYCANSSWLLVRKNNYFLRMSGTLLCVIRERIERAGRAGAPYPMKPNCALATSLGRQLLAPSEHGPGETPTNLVFRDKTG